MSTFGSARTSPIAFPRKPGRPRSNGHDAGTHDAKPRMNSGGAPRRVAAQTPIQIPDGARLLGVSQVATYLGLSTWTVRGMIETGQIPRVRVGDCRRVLVDRAVLDRMITGRAS